MNSRDLLEQINVESITHYLPQYEHVLDALGKAVNNEVELMNALAQQLTLVQCSCKREFPYSGKGVTMCGRCRVLVLYEMHTTGKSETQKTFDWEKP